MSFREFASALLSESEISSSVSLQTIKQEKSGRDKLLGMACYTLVVRHLHDVDKSKHTQLNMVIIIIKKLM